MSGENIPNDLRNRPQVKLTLHPDTITRLDALARRWGVARSRAVERIVMGYVPPVTGQTSTSGHPTGSPSA